MNKIILLIVGLIAIGGISFFSLDHSSTVESLDDASASSLTVVITYDNFEEFISGNDQLVLLDFWTPDCLPSLEYDALMYQIAKEFEGKLSIGTVDLSKYEQIGFQCGISRIPTLLFVRNGTIIHRTVGIQTRQQIVASIEEILGTSDPSQDATVKRIPMGPA